MPNLRTLAFDVENRPKSYNGEFPTPQITAIAACWLDRPEHVRCWVLRHDNRREQVAMLEGFRKLYDRADLVIGHYIRKHDLPIVNGSMMRLRLPALADKLTADTKSDWLKKKDISAKLEDMLVYYSVPHGKVRMSVADWEEANSLNSVGVRKTRERCVSDVRAQMALYQEVVAHGHLSAPKVWRP